MDKPKSIPEEEIPADLNKTYTIETDDSTDTMNAVNVEPDENIGEQELTTQTVTETVMKKERMFGGMRFGFGVKRKKRGNITEENSVPIETKSPKMKNNNKYKKKRVSSSKLESLNNNGMSSVASTSTLLPDRDLPAVAQQRPKLSSLAGSLVRKMSFGKLNAKKKPTIEIRTQMSSDNSPSLSSASTSAGSGYLQGGLGDGDGDITQSSGEYISLSDPTTTSLTSLKIVQEQSSDNQSTYIHNQSTYIHDQIGCAQATSTPLDVEKIATGDTAMQQWSGVENIPDLLEQSPLVSNIKTPKQMLEVEESNEMAIDQSDTTSKSHELNQWETIVMLGNTSNPGSSSTDYERSAQKLLATNQETLSYDGQLKSQVLDDCVPNPTTVTENIITEKSATVQLDLGKSSTFVLNSKPVVMSDISRGSEQDVPDEVSSTSQSSIASVDASARGATTSIASETYRLRTAWMSDHIMNTSKEEDEELSKTTEVNEQLAKPAAKVLTKEQILLITTPIWEQQQSEAEDKRAASSRETPVTPSGSASTQSPLRSEDSSAVTSDISIAGTSKNDVYLTPHDSPSLLGDSEVDVDSLSTEVPFSTPLSTASTSEESYSPPEPGPVDVMAQARARLSQNLGVSSLTTPIGDKREHLYKILVIGELGTGKTSIIKRYVHQFFSQHYRATIGVDFALKVLNWDANTIIRLQLWDIAGQERFGNMTRVYYKEAVGAFIVFDVTRSATFDAVVKWKQDLDSKVQLPDGSPIPCVLLANKCDQQKEGLVNYPAKMDNYCKEKGFSGWFETSAKENINIEEAARFLVTKILQNDQLRAQSDLPPDGNKINLDGNAVQTDENKSKCSC